MGRKHFSHKNKMRKTISVKQVKHHSRVNVYHVGGENVSLHLSSNYTEYFSLRYLKIP